MAVTTPTPMRTTREPEWTPRQREVLDLLVRGRTNSQIADTLGISLDGAKWHVSEIITRLGVDSRDEAAEYWRHHNGLRMRFTRIASGFFGSGALKWSLGSALVAGVVVASAMVIVALRDAGGEDTDRSGGVQNPDISTPGPTVPGATPPASPPPATTPLPTGETIAGIPVSHVRYGTPGVLPQDGLSLIVEKGCHQCDGPASRFERVTSEGGQMVVETLFDPDEGYIYSSYFDASGGAYYVSVCSRGYCGGVGETSPDLQTTLYRSNDGGVTWEDLATFDGPASVAMVTQQGPLLNLTTFADGGTDYQFQLLGSSTIVRPPAGTEPTSANGGRLVGWRETGTNQILGLDGSPLLTLPNVDSRRPVRVETVLTNGDVLVSWLAGPSDQEVFTYLGVMEDGKLTKIFRGSDSSLSIGTGDNANLVWGNVWVSPTDVDPSRSNNEGALHPMFMDVNTGEITILELYGPAFSDAYDLQRNRIREFTAGPFLRVTGAGSCLNVREQPAATAPVVQCFADNVLLKNLAQEQQAGGITWKKVQTPTGSQGWASAEFLKGTLPNP